MNFNTLQQQTRVLSLIASSLVLGACANIKLTDLVPKDPPAKKVAKPTTSTSAPPPAVAPKMPAPAVPAKMPSPAATAVCPGGITESCAAQVLKDSNQLDFNESKRRLQAVCENNSTDPKFMVFRQAACFEQAKIDAAQGRIQEAADLRRKACSLEMNFCIERMVKNYAPNYFEAVDLASIMCDKPEVKNTYVHKLYFSILCSLPPAKSDRAALEQAWVAQRTKAFSKFEEEIVKVRTTNKNLKPELDFSVLDKTKLDAFYRDLRKMSFPKKVKFNLSRMEPVNAPMDLNSDKSLWLLSGFSGGPGTNWTEHFAGYAGIPTAELIPLARKFPFLSHPTYNIPVTGTIIGYRETGVVPVPVLILDEVK